MPIRSYRDLDVWQCAMALARGTYLATRNMPSDHRGEIGSQMRRASLSTASNIAEGFRQGAPRAYLRHLRIAAGSTAELETQVDIATDLGLWSAEEGKTVKDLANRTGQMLTALIKALERRVPTRSSR